MAKPKIDLDDTGPITYARAIKIPTPSGVALDIKWTLKHRMRDEMAELMASYRQRAADAKLEPVDDTPMTKEQAAKDARAAAESDADAIMDVACGWDFEGFSFGKENLVKLCMRYPAAAGTILKDYSVSMYEGRLGN